MPEYIDREAFLKHMRKTNRYFGVKFDIEEFPAADVEPVRHGRWVKYAGKLVCSECKKYPPMKDESGGWRTYHEWPYCPNCGAKMEGEEGKR